MQFTSVLIISQQKRLVNRGKEKYAAQYNSRSDRKALKSMGRIHENMKKPIKTP